MDSDVARIRSLKDFDRADMFLCVYEDFVDLRETIKEEGYRTENLRAKIFQS